MQQDKKKLLRLFGFLKQYNNIKNPNILDIEKHKWSKNLEEIPVSNYIVNNLYRNNEEVIISIKKPNLTNCSIPPVSIVDWIEGNWRDPEATISYKEYLEVAFDGIYEKVEFKANKERVTAYDKWIIEWNEWAKLEIKKRECDKIYNDFFELYSMIKKESESVELMLGDGNLFYKSEKINHPIILQPVKLKFDANIPEFTLVFDEKDAELYKCMFNSIPGANHELLRDLYKEFEEGSIDPNNIEDVKSFLNRVSNVISTDTKFVNSFSGVQSSYKAPQIYMRPTLILRKKVLGFATAIDAIMQELNTNYNPPAFLEEVVGINSLENKFVDDINNLNPNGIDKNILLTKPANAEQLTVAKKLESHDAVLVQGPPGTGKTHTISNIIGHLLSEGKSILVTSYSEKALSVLKEKVTERLQPLCLSLLSTTESRKEMEATLDQINENRSRFDLSILKRRIEQLEDKRAGYIVELDNLKLKLKNARMSEYRNIELCGEEFTSIEAAKFIRNHKSEDWIPKPVTIGKACSLTNLEIIELYESNKKITKEQEEEYFGSLPDIDDLITPIEFNNLVKEKNKFDEDELSSYENVWRYDAEDCNKKELENLYEYVNQLVEKIDLNEDWKMAIIEDSKEKALKQKWINLVDEINKVYEQSSNLSDDIIKYSPQIDQNPGIDMKKEFESVISQLDSKGKLGSIYLMMHSNVKKLIEICKVNGENPKTKEEFEVLYKYYKLLNARNELKNRWNRQMATLGAQNTSTMREEIEFVCIKYCDILEKNINWYDDWDKAIKECKEIGIELSRLYNQETLFTEKYSEVRFNKNELGPMLLGCLKSHISRNEYYELKIAQMKLERTINEYAHNQNSNIVRNLQNAVIDDDVDLYEDAYEAIKMVNALSADIIRRKELLDRLKESAPKWADKIKNRVGNYGEETVNGDIDAAWKVRQFKDILEERNNISIEDIQKDINSLEKEIRYNTEELAFNRAWLCKLRDFDKNKEEIQAIESWRQTIRKIGKGTGKRAAELKAEARKLMPKCQSAVPVWIMPLAKVVENFNPQENKFDVVIIDEASQADIMALVALYIGKKVIIVGDNEQVSPMAIGEKTDELKALVDEYLYDIPSNHLYSGTLSIYDLAQFTGYQPIKLREHFRCVPDIIEYSNQLSYNGIIRPLRDDSQSVIDEPIIEYKVEGSMRVDKVNESEAKTIASLMLACLEQPEYEDMTFGAISLRDSKQADLIDKIVRDNLSALEYEKRNILCGNSANFQGDERDVIFLSMVDTNETDKLLRIKNEGREDSNKKRYNVAMSRAKDQVWLVHSLDVNEDLKANDMRRGLIEYCVEYKQRKLDSEESVNIESEFENKVFEYLSEKGYKVSRKWKIGSYKIDMVVLHNNNKVAIVCEGEHRYTDDKIEADMDSQSVLERLGWRFIRIRGSEFFQDEEACMANIFKILDNLNIYPVSQDVKDDDIKVSLKDRVIARANEIMTNLN